MKLLILIPFVFALSSCSSFQVFEKKVPESIRKNKDHLDNEKSGAYYLAINTTDQNQDVANALSRSLGSPNKIENDPKIIKKKLLENTQDYESKIFELNKQLDQFGGKKIDGTGFSLFPFVSSFGFIVIIILLVLFPSLASVLFFILKRTKKAFENVIIGIKEFEKDNPESAKSLEEMLEKKLDKAEKIMKGKVQI